VDKERVNYLINRPAEATKKDSEELAELIREYPYSQMLHILLAKIRSLQDHENKQSAITKAAIYASNRTNLKAVIQTEGQLESIEDIPVYQDLPILELEEPGTHVNQGIFSGQPASDSATIFDEVLKNLQKLKSLREQFLFLEEDDAAVGQEPIKEVKEGTSRTPSSKQQKAKRPKTDGKLKPHSKKEKQVKKEKINQIIEKDLELDSQVNEYFISEIAQKDESETREVTKKKVTEKQIIERFIQEQPSIGNIQKELEKSQDEITKDLSEKSTKFGDDLISENLAVILLKQGKKERAIDIYRKLIWKLPQKKAYFAARIEEIKK